MIHVYVENVDRRGPSYAVTPARWAKAMGDLPGLAAPDIHDASAPDLDALERADVFVGSGFDPSFVGRHGRRLKLVHCTSAGVDRYLPLDWLPAEAVFTNSRGIHAHKAREYATMALLAVCIRLPAFANAQTRRLWEPVLTPVASGRQVLIVGLGELGSAVAQAARALGMRVSAATRHGRPSAAADRVVPIANIEALLPTTDLVVLSCPLTPETLGLMDDRRMSMLPRGASLINMARGKVLDAEALIRRLESGHLQGAVLDAFDEEPLPADSPLWAAPNVLLTPHISCDEPEGYIERALSKLRPNLVALAAGQAATVNVVSRELGY